MLGEYGRLIVSEVPPTEQYRLLYALFPAAGQTSKGLLMTAFIKILLMEPNNAVLRGEVTVLFERYRKFMDVELQQRAVEYMVGGELGMGEAEGWRSGGGGLPKLHVCGASGGGERVHWGRPPPLPTPPHPVPTLPTLPSHLLIAFGE